MSREIPCPIRIVDDFGGGFGIGLGLGSILYFIRGCWYSPKSERVYGGITLLKKRAPILGGNFALWGGIFSTTECSLLYLRKTDDHFNPICAGFVTGGSLAIRSGARVALTNAVFGGIFLGIIQLFEIYTIKYQTKMQLDALHEHQEKQANMQMEYIQQNQPEAYRKIENQWKKEKKRLNYK